MFQKILVAYDGSQGAQRALDAVLKLAALSNAEVWALAVEDHLPRYAATVSETEAEKEFANHYYQERLSVAFLRALSAGVTLKSEIRVGQAARTIVDFVEEEQFDLVVLGQRGHGSRWRWLLSTTVEKVSCYAPCSVLLVR